ncbi:hypothetical protein [Azospirillum sp. sgz302134]
MSMRSLIAGLLLAGAVTGPAAAQSPGKSADQIKQMVEQTYNVQVLRVTEVALEDGTPAYRVAAMMPATAGNSAFLVNQMTVDAMTGTPVAPFRHQVSGYTLPEGGSYEPNRTTLNPAVARGNTWR